MHNHHPQRRVGGAFCRTGWPDRLPSQQAV